MRLYLDLCCFNRPFDNQDQLIVRLQTEAKLNVQMLIRSGTYELAWSAILDLENVANPDPHRMAAIMAWKILATVDIDTTIQVELLADELIQLGLKAKDALHIASAIEMEADFFITTDKAILRKMSSETRIRAIDPIDFVRHFEEPSDAN